MAEQRVSLVLSVTGQQQFEKAARSISKVEQAANKVSPTGGKVSNALRGLGSAAKGAIPGVSGLGAALSAALGPIAAVTSAAALVGKALNTAFERGAAEQKLRNFTSSTEEYNAALAVAADTASKFGMSQTEATSALADTYSRLKGLGFGLKETSEIYQGFQSVVLQSGTSAEDAAGAFLQLSQALGSGKLQGDELRSILERMPQLAQLIATSMGKSAGEIRAMGQEGKITSEVIYKALAQAGGAAEGFGTKLNEQQQAMKALGAAADQAFALIGKALSPAVIAVAQGFSWVVKELSDIWEYLAANVFPRVVEAIQPVVVAIKEAFKDVDWAAIGKAIKLYIVGYFEALVVVVRQVSKAVAFTIGIFKKLADSPAFKALLWPLQKAVELLGGVKDPVKEWKDEQSKVTAETAKTAENFSSLPEKVENTKEQAKALKQEQEGVTKAIQEAASGLDRQFQAQESLAELQSQLGQEKLQTEMALNDVLLQQAQRQLDGARSAEEREAAARDIYELTVMQAALELASTKAAIVESVRKVEAQRDLLVLKAKEIEAEVRLARAKGIATMEHEKALQLAYAAVDLANAQVEKQKAIAVEQMKQAEAIYQGKLAAAETAYEQNRVFEATKGAATEAARFAQNMGQAASSARAAASATAGAAAANSGAGMARSTESDMLGAASSNSYFMQNYYKSKQELFERINNTTFSAGQRMYQEWEQQMIALASEYNKSLGAERLNRAEEEWMKRTGGGTSGGGSREGVGSVSYMASGGYATGATTIVGEGAEGEYVIPASKMEAAMSRYSAGARGDSVIPSAAEVTVNYGGSTLNMGGKSYVQQDDVNGIVSKAVSQTLSTLKRSAKARLEAGIR